MNLLDLIKNIFSKKTAQKKGVVAPDAFNEEGTARGNANFPNGEPMDIDHGNEVSDVGMNQDVSPNFGEDRSSQSSRSTVDLSSFRSEGNNNDDHYQDVHMAAEQILTNADQDQNYGKLGALIDNFQDNSVYSNLTKKNSSDIDNNLNQYGYLNSIKNQADNEISGTQPPPLPPEPAEEISGPNPKIPPPPIPKDPFGQGVEGTAPAIPKAPENMEGLADVVKGLKSKTGQSYNTNGEKSPSATPSTGQGKSTGPSL